MRYGSSDPPLHHVAEPADDASWWLEMSWPARRPTLEEIYWFAGFFEGEGSFGPSFVKIGKAVLYPIDHLEAWDRKNTVTCRAATTRNQESDSDLNTAK